MTLGNATLRYNWNMQIISMTPLCFLPLGFNWSEPEPSGLSVKVKRRHLIINRSSENENEITSEQLLRSLPMLTVSHISFWIVRLIFSSLGGAYWYLKFHRHWWYDQGHQGLPVNNKGHQLLELMIVFKFKKSSY